MYKIMYNKSVAAAFVAQREAAEAMQLGQGAFDNPAEDAEAVLCGSAKAACDLANDKRQRRKGGTYADRF